MNRNGKDWPGQNITGVMLHLLPCLLLILSCKDHSQIHIPVPQKTPYLASESKLSQDVYYDKVLGAIVGSAIGDAMGASTEMWHRSDIQKEYGFITGLTTATREKSPEGTWRHNMIAGSTTDDTRWKYLMGQYVSAHRSTLSPDAFTKFISDVYQAQITTLSDQAVKESTDVLDSKVEQINWIKEWARVALAYQEGRDSYDKALARFYGGEMSCAGMLYSPMFGLIQTNPENAYKQAFDHALFDIGYAKDISGLTAAMMSLSLGTASMDSIIDVIRFVDPYEYKDSRLIGRLTESIGMTALAFVDGAKQIKSQDENLFPPVQFPGTAKEWTQLMSIYQSLERDQQAIAFHAGEIWQILIAGLHYGNGDFERTIQFIVNYGRDNDTVAAVAGMILGGQIGFDKLPNQMKEEILTISTDVIGIDLVKLAKDVSLKTNF